MKKLLAIRKYTFDVDLVLLILRLFVGYAFIRHGWGKIQHPSSWMGPQSNIPGILQILAAVSEFGGGIALMLGFLTRLGAFGLTCTMLVAVYVHLIVMGDPPVNLTGASSAEPAIIYLLVGLLFLVSGPGRFSLDGRTFGFRK